MVEGGVVEEEEEEEGRERSLEPMGVRFIS